MTANTKTRPITIDLNQFKLRIDLKNRIEATFHFNSPSRRFYLCVIALVVNKMKTQGKLTSIPLQGHLDLLALLNETVGASAGSSDKENLLPRIYRKWQHALPNLEEAPLFKVLGRRKEFDEGAGKTYSFTEAEKDSWANLFEYKGSEENIRLKFAVDKVGAGIEDVDIIYEGSSNGEAWEKFLSSLRGKAENAPETKVIQPLSAVPEAPASAPKEETITGQNRLRWLALAAAIMVIFGAGFVTAWKLYLKPAQVQTASLEKMAFPLPDKPSIAVLPFVNLSEDKSQEFFSDGLTEDIITALSKTPKLFVIARNSSFVYKGRPVSVQQVSRELGVKYVLEGGVQKSGNQMRITAQLVDAMTGSHLWAERYDRELKDFFAIQDEVTVKIIASVTGMTVPLSETMSLAAKGASNLDAYLKAMEGFRLPHATRDEIALARKTLEEAIALDPQWAVPYGMLSFNFTMDYRLAQDPQESLKKIYEYAQKALSLDETQLDAYMALVLAYAFQRRYDDAIAAGEQAVKVAPGSAHAHICLARSLLFTGKYQEALVYLERAVRMNPFPPWEYFLDIGGAHVFLREHEEAVSAFKKVLSIVPKHQYARLTLIVAYVEMGRLEEARAEAREFLMIDPKWDSETWLSTAPWKDPQYYERWSAAIKKVGLEDEAIKD